MELQDRVVGALLGTFVGDALGRPWEAHHCAAGRDARDRLDWEVGRTPLVYSARAQLTLVLAAHLLEHPGVDPAGLARLIGEVCDETRVQEPRLRELARRWRDGADVVSATTAVFPDGSPGSGAAVRATAVALRHPRDGEAREQAVRAQALLTNAHPVGLDAAIVVAEAVALAVTHGAFGATEASAAIEHARTARMLDPGRTIARWCRRWREGEVTFADVAAALGSGGDADRTIPAALWAAATAADPAEALVLALGLGGDTPTIAALAGAIRGAVDGRDALRHEWLVRLEDDAWGVGRAIMLGQQLAAAAAAQADGRDDVLA